MTNADTQAAGTGATPVGAVLSGAGLRPEPGLADLSSLSAVSGPLLTADIIDGGGQTIGTVAVLDDADADPDTLLQALAEAAASEAGGGAGVQPAEPVGGGGDLAARHAMPVDVVAYSDGQQVRAIHLSTADRRGSGHSGGATAIGASLGGAGGSGSLDKLINVALDVSVELGRTRVTLAEVLDYDVGSVVELDRAAGAPVDIRVNDTLLAEGEVVLIDDEYAVRITAIFDPNQGS